MQLICPVSVMRRGATSRTARARRYWMDRAALFLSWQVVHVDADGPRRIPEVERLVRGLQLNRPGGSEPYGYPAPIQRERRGSVGVRDSGVCTNYRTTKGRGTGNPSY